MPDLVAPGQRVWFVGTAAGPRSAALTAYYAHPGNRFWRALHEAGITPRLFAPADYPALAELGVGLTDFCKSHWGVDGRIPREAFDAEGLRAKVAALQPSALAFTSKTAASLWLGAPTGRIAHGRQAREEGGREEAAAGPELFVLPSPSGLATSWWSLAPWRDLGEWLEEARPAPPAHAEEPR